MDEARRTFLKTTLLLPALAIPSATSRAKSAPKPIVVIGAGLAGLAAARMLQKSHRQTIVLEAHNNPGGRVKTIRNTFDDNLYAEAGAARIANVHERVIRYVGALGLSLTRFQPADAPSLLYLQGKMINSNGDIDGLNADLSQSERGLGRRELLHRYLGTLPKEIANPHFDPVAYSRWRRYDHLSWSDFLRIRGASPGAIRLITLGAPAGHLSALYVLRQVALHSKAKQYFKISGGMDKLPRALATSLGDTVRYNATVTGLEQYRDGVQVDFIEQGRHVHIDADRVVIAVPFSILRNIEIRSPVSELKKQIINNLAYYPATRHLLQLPSRHRYPLGQGGIVRTDHPAEVWSSTWDQQSLRDVVSITTVGDRHQSRLTRSENDRLDLEITLNILSALFPQVGTEVERGRSIHWAEEPCSQGAFAIFKPGQMSTFLSSIRRQEGRLHFAGEHTSPWGGWMEGAIQSGERAATEIMHFTQN